MRWDDLSIWTTTPARAGVSANPDVTNPDMIVAAARTSFANRPPDRFMMTPCRPFLLAEMMSVPDAGCKGRSDLPARPAAINLNPQAGGSLKSRHENQAIANAGLIPMADFHARLER
jgi:hypothetical protein